MDAIKARFNLLSSMWEEILKGFSMVYLPSMVKLIFGPIGGRAGGLHLITTMVGTAAGMMTVVVVFTYFGEYIRHKILNRIFNAEKKETVSNKKFVGFFKRYGLSGIALLTPVILTPIGGVLLAVGFSSNREKIIFYMLISACVWSVLLTLAVYFGYDTVMQIIGKVQPI